MNHCKDCNNIWYEVEPKACPSCGGDCIAQMNPEPDDYIGGDIFEF